ncbi:MAG: Calx-beta domain-containing protein, partial [Isosphaeraceae bacterium]
GTDITGTSSLGNEVNGVIVSNEASGNRIGGPAASDGNAIAFNVLAGVSIESGTGNSILTNRIWANGRLGIDLVAPLDPRSGVTPNEPGVRIGPNNLQNAPVLVTAVAGGAGGSIQGTLESTARSTFTIQFFSNQVADPSGFGQGQTPIGSTVVTTDDQGRASFSYVPAEGLTSSRWISATATRDDTGDTSEFSNDVSAEPVSLEFSAASWAVEVSAGSALIHVRRAGNLNAIVSVRYATSDGTAVAGKDYSPASGVLTFQVGQTDKTFPVTLLANPDQTASFVTVNLALADPTGGATIGAIGSSVLTIYNNLPPILQFKAATYTTYSTSPSALVTVTRGGGSRELAVSVKYACSGGTASPGVDYSPVSGTLVFQANQTTTTFSVPIVPGSHPVGTVTVGLVLQDPSSGAELGTQSDATLRIITSNVNPVGPVDATPPQVVGRQLQLVAGGIEAVVFSFSKPMDAVRVQDLGNYGYYAILAGPDGQFGTSDDGWVALAAARYDAASRSIAVIPSSPLPWNQSARIVLNELASPILGRGLADTSGNLLSGAGNGVAGGPYVATFCAGTQFTYPDSRGKRISLNLTGGGVCVVFRSISGDPQSVALVGATPRKSVLKLHAGTGGGRTTSMPPIQGAAGVRIVYKPPAAFKGTPAPRSASFRKSGVRAR